MPGTQKNKIDIESQTAQQSHNIPQTQVIALPPSIPFDLQGNLQDGSLLEAAAQSGESTESLSFNNFELKSKEDLQAEPQQIKFEEVYSQEDLEEEIDDTIDHTIVAGSSQESIQDELIAEAIQFKNNWELFNKQFNEKKQPKPQEQNDENPDDIYAKNDSNNQSNEDDIFYLISCRWINKWKRYVSYNQVIKNQQPNYKYFALNEQDLEDANQDLILKNPSSYYQFPSNSLEQKSAEVFLKKELRENEHFILVSREIVETFQGRYPNFICIPRRSYFDELDNRRVEIYYLQVNLVIINHSLLKDIDYCKVKELSSRKIQIFSQQSQAELKSLLACIVRKNEYVPQYNYSTRQVDEKQIRLWKYSDETVTLQKLFRTLFDSTKRFNSYEYKFKIPNIACIERENSQITARELGIENGFTLIVEVQKQQGWFFKAEGEPDESQCEFCKNFKVLTVSCKCNKVKYCNEQCKLRDQCYHQRDCPFADESSEEEEDNLNVVPFTPLSIKGRCGLQNLGNSCYANSALQCLSNTEALTEYFLSKVFKSEINIINPLGSEGKVVKKYAKFIKNMWVNNSSVFSPSQLKRAVGKKHQMFIGYQQHDSQEFLACLLDILHEDLNRVKQKQSTEGVESQGKSDEQVAQESWLNHMMRNQSVIVDLMQGQFKSKVKCPDCSKESVTFDPFMTCSLPIPHKEFKTISAYVIYSNNRQPATEVSYTYDPASKKTVKNFKEHCAGKYSLQLDNIELFSLSYFSMKEVFSDETLLETFRKETKYNRKSQFIIEQEVSALNESKELTHVVVLFKKLKQVYFSNKLSKQSFTYVRPLLLNKSTTCQQIHLAIFRNILPFIVKQSNQDSEFLTDKNELTLEQLYSKYFINAEKKPYNLLFSTDCQEYSIKPKPCSFCKQSKCENCDLPYDSEETVQQLCDKSNQLSNIEIECEVDYSTDIGQSLSLLHSLEESINENEHKQEKSVQLEDCLQLFEQAEQLGEDNEWYCSRCKKHQQAEKQMQIYRLPQILILHLKRFKGSGMFKSKLSTVVDFPIEGLDMSNYAVKSETPSYYIDNSNIKEEFNKVFIQPTQANADLLSQIRSSISLNQNEQQQEKEESVQDSTTHSTNEQSDTNQSEQSQSQNEQLISQTTHEKEVTLQKEEEIPINKDVEKEATIKNEGEGEGKQQSQEEKIEESASEMIKVKKEKLLYDLYAVTNHYGNLGFGHYTAFAKNNNEWFYYDDSSVRKVSPDSIVSDASYILFYKKRN